MITNIIALIARVIIVGLITYATVLSIKDGNISNNDMMAYLLWVVLLGLSWLV